MSENPKKLVPVIKIKNFPSRQRVLNDFKLFLSERKIKEEYKIIKLNKPNKILFYVTNPKTAFKFSENYNNKILTNPDYSNSECSLTFKKPENLSKSSTTVLKDLPRKKLFLSQTRKVKSDRNYLSKSVSSVKDYERKHWANIRERACIINNDSPYIDELDREYNEKMKNMKKWIDKKNFNVFVGKASSIKSSNENEIKNYVMRTPSLPPIKYQFRTTQRQKWIDGKDFRLY